MKNVEIQIQLQNIHAWFAKESQVAALRVSLDKGAHIFFLHATRMSNAVNLEFRSGRRDIGVAAGEISGSRPDPEAVTKSIGIGAFGFSA